MQSWAVMTKSVTTAGLPWAGAKSKPLHYKQKVQKIKDHSKTSVLTVKQFEDFRKKNRNILLDESKKPKWESRALKLSIKDRLCKQYELNQTKLERRPSYQNCWNFAIQELRSQILTCSTFL